MGVGVGGGGGGWYDLPAFPKRRTYSQKNSRLLSPSTRDRWYYFWFYIKIGPSYGGHKLKFWEFHAFANSRGSSSKIGISVLEAYTAKKPFNSKPPPKKRLLTQFMWFEVNGRSTDVIDLRWPRGTEWQRANSTLAIPWIPNLYLRSNICTFASMAPPQVVVKRPFVGKIAGGCIRYLLWRHSSVT